MTAEIATLTQRLQMHERTLDAFLQKLVMHLVLDVPSFDGQRFLDGLYRTQTTLGHGANAPDPLSMTALAAWKRKIDAVEEALRSASYVKSRGDS